MQCFLNALPAAEGRWEMEEPGLPASGGHLATTWCKGHGKPPGQASLRKAGAELQEGWRWASVCDLCSSFLPWKEMRGQGRGGWEEGWEPEGVCPNRGSSSLPPVPFPDRESPPTSLGTVPWKTPSWPRTFWTHRFEG